MNPFDVNDFISTAGLIGLMVLLFMETGVLIGFIFPGDSVLFTAGIFAAQPHPFAELWQLLVFLPLAASVGDQVGYVIGKKFGPLVVRGRVMRWIGPGPLEKTRHFFDRYGASTVMFARFIGIVRTLTPIVAGYSGMRHSLFTLFSILGSIIWVGLITTAGYFLGAIPLIQDNFEILIIGSVLTILVPMVITVFRRRRRARQRSSLPLDTDALRARTVDE